MFCFSQSRVLDSLHQELNNFPGKDSLRLNLLIKITSESDAVAPENGIKTGKEAIILAEELKLDEKLYSAYMNTGNNYWVLGRNNEAFECFNNARNVAEKLNNKKGKGRALNNLALLSFNKGSYEEALQFHEEAGIIFKQIGEKKLTAINNLNKAVVLQFLGDYTGAHDVYIESLRIFQLLEDTINYSVAHLNNNLGIVNKNLGNFDFALSYYLKALKTYEALEHKKGKADVLSNIGVLYMEMEEYKTAVGYFLSSAEIGKEIGYKKVIASNLTNEGISLKEMNDYKSALEKFNSAKLIYEEIDDKNSQTIVLNQLALLFITAPNEVLAAFGIPPSGKYKLALAYQQKGLQIAGETGATDRLSELYEGLSETYAGMGDHKNAYAAYQRFIVLRDSIVNNKNANIITRRQVKFEFDMKELQMQAELEKQKALAEAEIQFQKAGKNFALAASILIVSAGVFIWILYKKRRDAEEERAKAEFNKLVAETEMEALRSRLNPHFIFNSLNSIADYIERNEQIIASEYISKFSSLMREILENSPEREISLREDLNMLEKYLQLERLRLNNKFDYSIEIDPDLNPEKVFIPPMIMQPFVENAIWHGVGKLNGEGMISIKIQKPESDMIRCTIADNGPGRVKNNGHKRKAFGTEITQARIDILNKTMHGHKAGLNFIDKENGLEAVLNLPLIED